MPSATRLLQSIDITSMANAHESMPEAEETQVGWLLEFIVSDRLGDS